MHRSHFRVLAGLLIVLVAAIAFTQPAAAAGPVRDEFVLREMVDVDCGAFVVREDRTLFFKVLVYLDDEGEPTLVQLHIHGTVVRTNLETGMTSTEYPAVAVFIDLVEETFTIEGGIFIVIVEGGGIVIQDAGRVVFGPDGTVLFEAGPQESLHDPGLICSHLG